MTKHENIHNIKEYLSIHRKATAKELAEYIGVTKRTIINYLYDPAMNDVPFATIAGNGGGIIITDKHWKSKKSKLSEEQIDFLYRMAVIHGGKDAEIAASIIAQFKV